jgi:hypothetical protein
MTSQMITETPFPSAAPQQAVFTLPRENPEITERLAHFENTSLETPWITVIQSTQITGYETESSRPPVFHMSQQESSTQITNSWKFMTILDTIFRILTLEDNSKLADLVSLYTQPPESSTFHETAEGTLVFNELVKYRKINLLHHLGELKDFQNARSIRENAFSIFSLREEKLIADFELPSTPIEIEPFAQFQREKNVPKYFGNPFVDVLFQLVKDFIIYSIKSLNPEDYDDNETDGASARVYNNFRYNNQSGLWQYPNLSSVPGHSLYLYALLYNVLGRDNYMITEPELPLPFFESGKRLTEDRFATIIAIAARMLLAILQQNRNT